MNDIADKKKSNGQKSREKHSASQIIRKMKMHGELSPPQLKWVHQRITKINVDKY